MHIGIDASRYNNLPTKTGVEWYSHHLIPGLVERAHGDGHQISLYTPSLIAEFPESIQCVLPAKRLWSLYRLSRHFIQKKHHPDVFFVPSHILPPITAQSSIVTIHDVAFHHHPEYYSTKERLLLEYSVHHAKTHARHIITVSESTKRDLVQEYHIPQHKISVIPLGYQARPQQYTPEEIKETLTQYHLQPKHYFVFLGRIEKKKNIQRLIEAFTAANLPQEYKLVLIGKPGYGGEELVQQLYAHPQVIHTGYLDDQKTGILLSQATALTIPSLYEGFCMPILEGYAQHLPVLTSKHSSMPEVAGEGALLVDPTDTTAIRTALEQLAHNPTLRAQLIQHGQQQVAKFTWKHTIDETYKLLTTQSL